MSLSQFQLFFLMLKLNLCASLTSRSPFMLGAVSFDMPSKSDNLFSFWHKRYPRFSKYLLFLKSAASPYLWKSQLYNFGSRLSQCSWTLFTFKPFLLRELLLLLLPSRFSRVRLCATPEMAAHQAFPSLGFSRQEHWSGLPFPSPMQESEKWKWSHSVVPNS